MPGKENSCPVPKGRLMLIGGAEDKGDVEEDAEKFQKQRMEILDAFLKLIHKKEPTIEVVTTATSEPDETLNDYKTCFKKLGVKNIGHIHHRIRKEILSDGMTDRLKAADAVFFTGGDQLLLTSIYGGTLFLKELKEKYIYSRFLVAGTSAGAMALSTPMIYAGNKNVQQIVGEIKVTTGLEFLKDVCIDTHFVHRSRFVRMAQVIATNPGCIGIGIEENTAVVVSGGNRAEVIGEGVVAVMDGMEIGETNIHEIDEECKVSIRNMRISFLGRGEVFEIPMLNPPHQ